MQVQYRAGEEVSTRLSKYVGLPCRSNVTTVM